MSAKQLQRIIHARIAGHASRVERMGLGSDSKIQSDVKEAIEGVLRWTAREEDRRKGVQFPS